MDDVKKRPGPKGPRAMWYSRYKMGKIKSYKGASTMMAALGLTSNHPSVEEIRKDRDPHLEYGTNPNILKTDDELRENGNKYVTEYELVLHGKYDNGTKEKYDDYPLPGTHTYSILEVFVLGDIDVYRDSTSSAIIKIWGDDRWVYTHPAWSYCTGVSVKQKLYRRNFSFGLEDVDKAWEFVTDRWVLWHYYPKFDSGKLMLSARKG